MISVTVNIITILSAMFSKKINIFGILVSSMKSARNTIEESQSCGIVEFNRIYLFIYLSFSLCY